ncbi:BatA domain-containing protein [Adhaeribacter rhizoryzae]|uniref:Aerotolerance regulator N-terminal domain-containing protein n=1 Tax=Adhaeribacter rhizoryzae TaxID=2607907 RepID=A0A5M6CX63_9BACT|nr:BatA domain-containing protein [Adhaeribacter rhizoryzae]KAA5539827.1 hypothetical protein F0145_23870 [Adhaeribacter rhizoryzae]
MLQLLSAYWLWALTGLLVPVLIHLWNKKQPKVIKVGSVRWLQAAASQQARQLQLHDWPLLLLRCFLLLTLVLFLCQPVWQQISRQPGHRYLWVSPSLLQPQNLPLVQTTIDSLLKNNYQLREFSLGFLPISTQSWENLKTGKEEKNKLSGNLNYWALANAVHQQFYRAQEHLFVTDNQFVHFAGARPLFPASSRWLTIPVNQYDSLFVQEAFQNRPDSLTVVIGQKRKGGIRFSNISFTTPTPNQVLNLPGLLPLIYTKSINQAFISFQNSPNQVPVKKSGKNIALYYDKSREQDSKYVSAALAALSSYTGRRLNLTQITATRPININHIDWLFWLSDQPLPVYIQMEIKKGLSVFKDAPTTPKLMLANFITTEQLPTPISLAQQVRLVQQGGNSVWQNNFGEPVLQYKSVGQGGLYYFGSRFNNQWNNLPQSSFIPELLSYLIFPEAKIRQDWRELENIQVQPSLTKTTQQPMFYSQVQQDLKYLLLALGALLFLTERWWAYKKGKRLI